MTADAELVLNGHDHNYERFAPQQGIREVVVGTGGASLRAFRTLQPNSEVRNATTFGVLKVTLAARGYSARFIPIAGRTFTDSFSGTCH